MSTDIETKRECIEIDPSECRSTENAVHFFCVSFRIEPGSYGYLDLACFSSINSAKSNLLGTVKVEALSLKLLSLRSGKIYIQIAVVNVNFSPLPFLNRSPLR